MTDRTNPRSPADSRVQMTEIVLPEDTNSHGTIFGGRVLALIDKCAAVAAMRHSRSRVVTVSMDSVTFVNPVREADILILCGRLNASFLSSMEIEVEVFSEDPLRGTRTITTTAFVTMVAVDDNRRPAKVPALAPGDEDDARRAAEAAVRRRERLSRQAATTRPRAD